MNAFTGQTFQKNQILNLKDVMRLTRLGRATIYNMLKAIVEFIIQHLQSQLGQENPLTLGVVTFNMTQQKLIEDLLDNELANHPELETLSKPGIEPLFIKNLENVQGDERDIIVFSIIYAKDLNGRLSMNFGALRLGSFICLDGRLVVNALGMKCRGKR